MAPEPVLSVGGESDDSAAALGLEAVTFLETVAPVRRATWINPLEEIRT